MLSNVPSDPNITMSFYSKGIIPYYKHPYIVLLYLEDYSTVSYTNLSASPLKSSAST